MTTLAANMTADQRYIPNTGITAGFYQLDSEMIRVRSEQIDAGRGRDRAVSGQYVDRGIGGTTPAAHSSGATVTTVNEPSTPGGGAVQTVTRVGPIARTFETPDIDDSAAVAAVADMPAGSLLVSAWAVVRESFDDGSGNGVVDLYLAVRPAAGSTPLSAAIHYAIGGGDPSPKGRDLANAPAEFPANPVYSFPIVAQDDCEFVAYVSITGGITLTQGDIDIYALIATPA